MGPGKLEGRFPLCPSSCSTPPRSSAGAQHLRRLSLRFSEQGVEDGFLRERSRRLPRGVFSCGACVFVAGAVAVASGSYRREDFAAGPQYEVALRCTAAEAALAALGLIAALLAALQQRWPAFSPLCCEVGCALWCCSLAVVLMFTQRDFMARILGVEGLHGGPIIATDAWFVLALDVIVSASHTLLAVRWCALWPVEVVCVVAYIVLQLIAQSAATAADFAVMLFTLVLLVVLSAMAARTSEVQDRRAFGMLLLEKTQRAEREFKLAQHSGDRRVPSLDDSASRNHEGGGASRVLEAAATPTISGTFSSGPLGSVAPHPTEVEGSLETSQPMLPVTSSPSNPSNPSNRQSMAPVVSATSTTATGKVFDFIRHQDPRHQLAGVIHIGAQERWLLPASSVAVYPTDLLGTGGFGVVVKGDFQGTRVAIKIPRHPPRVNAVLHLLGLANELRILRHVRHPHIVLFFGAVVDADIGEIALVLELVDGSPLDAYLSSGTLRGISERYKILLGVCCALQYLHAHQPVLLHGDIKSNNILVQEGGHPKLLDFGLSHAISHRPTRNLGGTLSWMAPEVFLHNTQKKGTPPGTAADVFAFGCVVHFVATGQTSQHGASQQSMLQAISTGQLPPLPWADSAPFTSSCKALAERCIVVDAATRPNMAEVLDILRSWPREHPALAVGQVAAQADESASREFRLGLRHARQLAEQKELAKLRQAWLDREDDLQSGDQENHNDSYMLALLLFHSPHTTLAPVPEAGEVDGMTSAATRSMASHTTSATYRETPAATQRLMLAEVMLRWHIKGAHGCCAFHRGLGRLSGLCAELAKAKCKPDFPLGMAGQCPECGALFMEKEESSFGPPRHCDVCGQSFGNAGGRPVSPKAPSTPPSPHTANHMNL